MKTLKYLSMMMLVAMAFPMMVACGDNNDDGGASDYTEAEIVELLTGKWEVYGELKIEDYDTKEIITDNYKGTLEFKDGKSFKFVISEGTPQGHFYYEELFIYYDYYWKYAILKKNGRNYISFGTSYSFEIVNLTKTTFKMIMNEEFYDFNDKSKNIGHAYMTLISN